MTKEEAKLVLDNARPQTKEIDRQFYDDEDLNNALDLAIKALEQQKPLEKFENVKDHICKLADDYKCWDNRLSHEESLELCNILKQQSDDCVSRASVKELFQEGCVMGMYDFLGIDDLPPVTLTHCIAEVRFSKEDLREICNERIEIACEHGTCKDCKHNKKSHNAITLCYTTCDLGHRFELREPSTFYCADFEKRGDLDGSN